MNKSLVTNIIALLLIAAGYLSPWWGEQFLSVGIFAFSGAVTNWLAVYMLFERVPLLYGSGVIPRHFEEIKVGLKELIIREFFSSDKLEGFVEEAAETMVEHLDMTRIIGSIDLNGAFEVIKQEILQSKMGGMLSMFGGGELLEQYREPFLRKTIAYLHQEMGSAEKMGALLKGAMPSESGDAIGERIANLVQRRLDELTPQQVKKIVQDMIRQHLGWLVVWGGVFGGLIGLVMSFLPQSGI